MKTMKNILVFLGFVSALSFMSCETPLALGERLDVNGPVVNFITPKPRQVVTGVFPLSASVWDASGIDKVLLRISQNRQDLPKQWRYENGKWKISENYGATWADFADGKWNGNDKAGTLTLPIDMSINGVDPEDGEYLFILQAWDTSGFSDDNSVKMLVLIIDNNPPSVSISNPYLYDGADPAFATLKAKTGEEWRDPAMIGKFQTRDFLVQWQIDDNHDIWSFDLRFYDENVVIDDDPETSLPTNYNYIYRQNLPPSPGNPPDPQNYIKPNGSVLVPALEGEAKEYFDDKGVSRGNIRESITGKKTFKVVAICYDAAGLPNEERTLGYFIYWPQADAPWITYTSGMDPLSKYNNNGTATVAQIVTNIKRDAFMIYPGRTISANAFHYHGLKEVTYTLYLYNETSGAQTQVNGHTNIKKENTPRESGVYPTGFPWNFTPPLRPGIYIIKASPKALDDRTPGIEQEAVFRIQDTTFPDFPVPPSPPASEPFFMSLNSDNTAFTISGIVSDAAEISSLCLVWINPESSQYASMAQLEYFRDHSYAGWRQAKKLTPGSTPDTESRTSVTLNTGEIYPFDDPYWNIAPDTSRKGKYNKLWRLTLPTPTIDPETQRALYSYSVTINLSDLNIDVGNQPLRSQVFLLRAENPDERATVITYAPQGDTKIPIISIDRVDILRGATTRSTVYPIGKPGYNPNNIEILKFDDDDVIRISGSWEEDTTTKLPPQNYLYNNMSFTINGEKFTGSGDNITIVYTPSTGISATGKGSFTINATVGSSSAHKIKLATLKDTLVVGAWVKDFGGNESEDSASWLVQTDELSLLRISSEAQDKAYMAGDTIELFLEFNKPVMKKTGTTAPTLTLNTTGGVTATATFKTGQTTENTRQYFTYTVGANQNTATFLDVTTINDSTYTSATYPFSWVHTPPSSNTQEEIRILAPTTALPSGTTYTTQNLPTGRGTVPNPEIRSLIANKEIQVDTSAPTLTGITGTEGWHGVGAQIYITATFSKPIRINTTNDNTVPYLTFDGIANTPATGIGVTSRRVNDVRVVNDKTITFVYTVQAGNNTTNELIVNTINGSITDIPGTAFSITPGTGNLTQRTLSGVYIDTTAPPIPTVQVQNSSGTVITSNVDTGTTITADTSLAGTGAINLRNVYLDSLRLYVSRSANTNRDGYRVEYSANNGTSWGVYTDVINWISTDPNGAYQITARQIDRAGNVSDWSRPIVFNWDKGAIVTSINSTSPNGAYTYNSNRQDNISITVNFRKPLSFSAAPYIRLNTIDGVVERAENISATSGTSGANTGNFATNTLYDSITFNYPVAAGHSTNGLPLNVTSLNRNSATSNVRDADRVAISTPTDLFVKPPTDSQLPAFKTITVDTTPLIVTTTAQFTAGTVTDANTYNTSLTVTFSHPVSMGTGTMEIIQTAASYRLPAVLTEAERTRYRTSNTASGGASMEALFDEFYTRGTNGLDGDVSDTSIKYVLNYDIYPNRILPNGAAAATNIQKLAEAFRQAEKLQFSATANVVSFANTNHQLVVKLEDSNALRVPGGTYEVTIPAGFVQNDLSRPSDQITQTGATALSAGGVARPFIRVRKAQETVTAVNTGTAVGTPRIVATQPLTTTAKIDTRTPIINNANPGAYVDTNARIRYIAAERLGIAPTEGANWWTPAINTQSRSVTIPGAPADPQYNAGAAVTLTPNTEITIGGDLNNQYQGFIWRVKAIAFRSNTANDTSQASNEAAYRTVFTYQINNMAAPQNDSEQRARVGDQIWLRGGDGIGSSAVPGYPLTWVDDWQDLNTNKKRAGIRLMTLVDNVTADNNNVTYGTWKWVSWEITVETYFDIILGRHADGSPTDAAELARIKHYGPRQWAYQRAGWTSFKDDYTLIPGNHRWVITLGNEQGKGAVNFSNTWSYRPTDLPAGWTYP